MTKTKKPFDYAGWPVNDKLTVGDTTTLAAEVNGSPKGAKVRIKEVHGDGAVFRVELLNGRKFIEGKDQIFRIKASDLN